ncbi:putative lupeol synthase [Helianthus annuus]|uniref:Lupeol synthase n=2 Tax=Helianthus annuus TaxID=4232 RepID=A0A9K3IX13_HELAN|nr:putative lupeol synthase [Helianthus annuus]KAJ0569269.1 putative lupeol synthase [Helianthus annuus]KAJ0583577.1 putative lupeol synthase [Helianthus annuus]KAJ0917763.1 putative lupeol synthase [Helianthus annuus]
MYRHTSKGAWTFSIQDHGWQVSDCTAEGLKVALLYSQMNQELVGEKLEIEHLYEAVNVILSLQSENGGFPAWEPQRAYSWLEVLIIIYLFETIYSREKKILQPHSFHHEFQKFNPTEFFEDVMIEREYVECTSSAVQGLALFKKFHPGHRIKEIEHCISRALKYIHDTQNPDGSWYGCWGICYTYGTWFAVDALVACGMNYGNSPALQKACEFLLSKQLSDGGWGESYLSSANKEYTNLDGNRSNLVQTSWALISLIKAGQVQFVRHAYLLNRKIQHNKLAINLEFLVGGVETLVGGKSRNSS